MRIAGALLLVAGLLIGAALLLVPASPPGFDGEVQCGMPFANALSTPAFGSSNYAAQHECQVISLRRLMIGAVLGGIACTAGLIMYRAGDPGPDPMIEAAEILGVHPEFLARGLALAHAEAVGSRPPG